MSKLLSRDQILKADDLPTEDVDVPEWGGTVRVRGLTGTERDSYEAAMLNFRTKGRKVDSEMDMSEFRVRLVAKAIVDAEGKRLFSDRDVRALGMKSAVALNRIYEVAERLSGLTSEDVEELAKNSETGPSDDFTSD